ncbi:S-layer homology domain-containing protein [Bacillus sp. 3255]|uniref:S-layer homology domain-containing protein n=1 Tax=Bacillus sp. 3255 TaxID=2817904 RepID=UPI0028637407|nr:S-layer homology domain-containing protein [Bacillus sp. 3255]MDR6881855.1 hypothetical protein [Bacillus sp. 3255]
MTTNRLSCLRMLLAVLLFSTMILQASPVKVFANTSLTVSQTLENNKAEFKVVDAVTSNDAVSILVMQKQTNSVVYTDQAVLANGEFTFSTLLPKGEYSGFVSSASNEKVMLQDFRIVKEESIVGFRSLNPITAAKGAVLVLPSSVVAVFDDGANREIGVQWMNVPTTDRDGQYTLIGKVNGSSQTVSLAVKVGDGSAGGGNNNNNNGNNSNNGSGHNNTNSGGTTSNNGSTSTVNSSTITVPSKLDSSTAAAKAEVAQEAVNHAFAQAAADKKGVKTVIIHLEPINDAEAYELSLPASVLVQGGSKQIIAIHTPVGDIKLPGNMVKSAGTGSTTISVSIKAVDLSTIVDPEMREAIGDRPIVELNLLADGKVMSWENKDAPVQVSVKYTPRPEENPEHLVVWYIDGAGKAVKVPNAKYDPATGTVTFRTSHFSTYAVSYGMKTFDDAGIYPWAQAPIEVLASKGIINGITESEFRPAEKITRADFVLLLIKTLGLTADFSDNFSDVSPSDYYYEAVGIAKKLGIANGTGTNTFNPKENISRQDLMVLSARALTLAGILTSQGKADDIQSFSDKTDIASYAVEDIAAMVREGIVSGDGSLLHPRANATRAETAAIMYRIFNKL